MITQNKSQPAPDCLALEKAKAGGTYRCPGVIEVIKVDFNNKCYICESQHPTSINVEHFVAHKGNKNLEFDWNNLFFACAHCNNIKLAIPAYNDILNCTDPDDNVEKSISYHMDPYPREDVEITALANTARVNNTVSLLNAVYNGTTVLKSVEASNLRTHLLREIRYFQDLLIQYDDITLTQTEKAEVRLKIERAIRPSSQFAAFKRWILRNNSFFSVEFAVELA